MPKSSSLENLKNAVLAKEAMSKGVEEGGGKKGGAGAAGAGSEAKKKKEGKITEKEARKAGDVDREVCLGKCARLGR